MSIPNWFIVHLLVGAVGAAMARGYARRRAMVDEPGERRSHSVPTPRGGGAAIAVSLLLATCWLGWTQPGQLPLFGGCGIGLALVSLVGWMDDHRPLPAWSRLAVHIVAGSVFALGAWLQSGDVLAGIVAFVATVMLVNVWNFMDGIDGLAPTQAILAALVPALLAGMPGLLLGIALVASTLGFLPWNFPRARLFLGDVGSGALGFALGALVALAVVADGIAGLALALLPLCAFMVDAGMTLARRMLQRERWWRPHVTHAYQVAARRHGHAPVTLAFGAFTLVAAGIAVAFRDAAFTSIIISLLLWYALAAAGWWRLRQGSVLPDRENME